MKRKEEQKQEEQEEEEDQVEEEVEDTTRYRRSGSSVQNIANLRVKKKLLPIPISLVLKRM